MVSIWTFIVFVTGILAKVIVPVSVAIYVVITNAPKLLGYAAEALACVKVRLSVKL